MDFSGKRIVIIGDSHVDASTFGRVLESTLRERGANVTRFGWGSSAARTWLAGKPISTTPKWYTLAQVNQSGPYDLALVCLGTNDGANSEAAAAQGGPSMVAGVATAVIPLAADALAGLRDLRDGSRRSQPPRSGRGGRGRGRDI
jgi:hypothetical protein